MNLFREDFLCIETTSIIHGGGRNGEAGGGSEGGDGAAVKEVNKEIKPSEERRKMEE